MKAKLLDHPAKKEDCLHGDFHYYTEADMDDNIDCFEGPFRTEEFNLILILKGSVKGRINLHEIEIGKHSVLFTAPNVVKQMIYKSEDCKFAGFAFSSSFLAQIGIPQKRQDILELLSNVRIPHIRLSKEECENIFGYFKNISRIYAQTESKTLSYTEELIHTNFLSVFYELGNIARRYKKINNKFSRKEDMVMQFGTLAVKHFKERKQLQYYADQVYVTPKYLTETVKEITGKTAGEILDELLMKEAKLLLRDSGKDIGEISNLLNFSDQSFFGKYFKRHAGVSPKQFRIQNA